MDKVELPLLKGKEREKCIPLAVIVGVAILIFVLSLAFLSLTFEQDYKLHYSETSDLDYKVYLKKNNFYSEKYLEKDQTYIASLIDCINAFFANNLNISETSRNAFLHRNTLLYRIEKISRVTGLNIRNFDDAMTFKMLLIIFDKINERYWRK